MPILLKPDKYLLLIKKMKKVFGLIILIFFTTFSQAQTSYFQGEWTVKNESVLFTCICKLEIKNTVVAAEFAWTFITIDSTNSELIEFYKNKKGNAGIEYTEGNYNQATGDIDLVAVRLDDPNEILGMTKYQLKYSLGKKAIYGTTTGIDDEEPGIFYAVLLKNSQGAKKFKALISTIKK
jgi:hypothetical protein